MTKRALITGVAGQDGTYLRLLLDKGYDAYGVTGPYPGAFLDRVEASDGMLQAIDADITDMGSLLTAETVELGWNTLVDMSAEKIVAAQRASTGVR